MERENALANIYIPLFCIHITKNESKLYANRNHRFQLQVDLPSPYSLNKRTQQVLEIGYMIPQRKMYEGQGRRILPIEDVQQYGSNLSMHPM